MKEIRIKELKIKNFKGIKNKSFEFDNLSVNIFGDNATGKTTIVDAFLWLLFNKNSAGSTDFSIKPIDVNGNILHNAEYSVSAVFSLKDENCQKEIELKKVLREKYTKKRGETTSTFTGHETFYFKDGSPKLLKEYQQEVDKLCNEDSFRMLTAPFYFNRMDKKTKRDVLLKAIPNISNLDIVEKDVELYSLLEDLKTSSIEELIAKHKSNAGSINKQLPSFEYKIEELNNMITNLDIDDKEGIEKISISIEKQKEYIAELQIQKNSKTNIVLLNSLNSEISELNSLLEKLRLENLKDKNEKLKKLQNELFNLQNEEFKIKSLLFEKKSLISKCQKNIELKENEIEDLKSKIELAYKQCEEIDNLEYDGDSICPTCGQQLPSGEIDKAIELFNLDKANKLEKAIKNGKFLKEEINSLDIEKNALNAEKMALENELQIVLKKSEEIQLQIENKSKEILETENLKVQDSEEILETKNKITKKEEEKEELLKESTSATELAFVIKQEQLKLDELYNQKARFEQNLANRKRIEELTIEQQKMAEEYNKAIYQVMLCEKFLKTKIKIIEKDVNNLFEKVKFTMFKEQINGGYEEVCYATIDGVPFEDANNAAKINAGLDIIKTLQKVENTIAPIFIDNAESVTNFEELANTQIIKLYVKENEKELKMEVK